MNPFVPPTSSSSSSSASSSGSSAATAGFAGESPISPGVQAVVELFDTDLAQLRFPDVDQAVLGDAAARVLTQAETVAAAEVALATAREALNDAQETLLGKCQRALAYARVYAEEDRDLLRKLETISLPRSRAKAAPTSAEPTETRPGRRGRRSAPTSGPLFLDSAGTAAAAEDGAAADSCAA